MSFELFDRHRYGGGSRSTAQPQVGRSASGQLKLNDAAYQALGRPSHLTVKADREQGLMAIHAADGSVEFAHFPLSQQRHIYWTSARSLWTWLGLSPAAEWWEAQVQEEGLLVRYSPEGSSED